MRTLTRSSGGTRLMAATLRVRTGLAMLRDQSFAPLRGLRVGLVTHAAAVDEQLRSTVDLLAEAPDVYLVALFGPEHGLSAEAQDMAGVGHRQDAHSGRRIYSLYGDTFESL